MLARESVANYDSQLGKYTEYVADQIKTVIGNVGPRESGCDSEHKAQDYVAEHMSDIADTVVKEDFTLHPKAFMGWVVIDSICMTISVIILILTLFGVVVNPVLKVIMFALTVVSVVCIVGEFLLYKQMLDPLFPKKDAYNVICTRKSAGQTKRRIILSGHIDSAYEWRYTYLGGGHCLTAVTATAIVCLVANLIINILVLAGVTAPALVVIMKIFAIISLPSFVSVLFFLNWKLVVPGANDNLTGVFASMAVLRFLSDNDIRFENTEVVAISMACEEAGLRGAKNFAKKHAAEYDKEDIETIAICTDTLRDFDYMGIYNRDMTGTVKLDKDAANILKQSSVTAGLDLPFSNVFFGSSDAAALVQGGMKAVCLAAMDPTPARYYHTRLDTADNLDERTIKAGVDTLIEAAFLFDEKGFNIS